MATNTATFLGFYQVTLEHFNQVLPEDKLNKLWFVRDPKNPDDETDKDKYYIYFGTRKYADMSGNDVETLRASLNALEALVGTQTGGEDGGPTGVFNHIALLTEKISTLQASLGESLNAEGEFDTVHFADSYSGATSVTDVIDAIITDVQGLNSKISDVVRLKDVVNEEELLNIPNPQQGDIYIVTGDTDASEYIYVNGDFEKLGVTIDTSQFASKTELGEVSGRVDTLEGTVTTLGSQVDTLTDSSSISVSDINAIETLQDVSVGKIVYVTGGSGVGAYIITSIIPRIVYQKLESRTVQEGDADLGARVDNLETRTDTIESKFVINGDDVEQLDNTTVTT